MLPDSIQWFRRRTQASTDDPMDNVCGNCGARWGDHSLLDLHACQDGIEDNNE